MPLLRVVKNKPYFKRFQVKYRRRREGKTDYYARRRLVRQDVNKYGTPKHRLVVRFTNKDIICQIVYAKIQGDLVLCSAYSHELPRYGIKVGLTNYAAAYATGLLLARRLLQKLKLDKYYAGKEEANGEIYQVEPIEDSPRPFRCYLDVGLARTTTGNRIFAAMKGAADGGLNIPHNEKRLVGYNKTDKQLETEVLRAHIFGQHVADYMRQLQESDEEAYKRQFSQYIKHNINSDDIEKIYEEAHKAIRNDPSPPEKRSSESVKELAEKSKKFKKRPIGLKQRLNYVKVKKTKYLDELNAA